MRTSLTEIKAIEEFLSGKKRRGESLVFEAKMILNPILRWNTVFQSRLIKAVALYHRRNQKQKMRALHNNLMNDPARTAFRNELSTLFNSEQ